jgi:hypothetical protein
MTEDQLRRFEAVNFPNEGIHAPLCAEIRRCWARITELLEANNAEVERRRDLERELESCKPKL